MKLSDYTFKTFIDTPSNHLARLAAFLSHIPFRWRKSVLKFFVIIQGLR